MEMFDWLIGFPLQLLKDITVWALNLLGMENMAKALDEFPLVETIRSMFKTIVDIIIIPLGFLMASAGTILTGLFDTLSVYLIISRAHLITYLGPTLTFLELRLGYQQH